MTMQHRKSPKSVGNSRNKRFWAWRKNKVKFFLSHFSSKSFRFQEFCGWQDEPFEEMDSTLVVQQYIQQLIRKEPSNVELILSMPDGQDEGVWKYEHLRYAKENMNIAIKIVKRFFLLDNFAWN